jgi:hypothetical protein
LDRSKFPRFRSLGCTVPIYCMFIPIVGLYVTMRIYITV